MDYNINRRTPNLDYKPTFEQRKLVVDEFQSYLINEVFSKGLLYRSSEMISYIQVFINRISKKLSIDTKSIGLSLVGFVIPVLEQNHSLNRNTPEFLNPVAQYPDISKTEKVNFKIQIKIDYLQRPPTTLLFLEERSTTSDGQVIVKDGTGAVRLS
jgi:hypothetical protein